MIFMTIFIINILYEYFLYTSSILFIFFWNKNNKNNKVKQALLYYKNFIYLLI